MTFEHLDRGTAGKGDHPLRSNWSRPSRGFNSMCDLSAFLALPTSHPGELYRRHCGWEPAGIASPMFPASRRKFVARYHTFSWGATAGRRVA